MKSRLHIVVHGYVQGVFFRANTQELANRLGLTGWVRNSSNGSVEILAEGEKEKLDELLRWCQRGPSGALVEKVESEWLEFRAEFNVFSVSS